MTAERCPTCHRMLRRTNPQNAIYWALLHEMSLRKWPHPIEDGVMVTYSADQFHAYYKSRFLGCDDIGLPNGKVISIPRSTANLDIDKFADYFDKVQADAAERGVYLADVPA